jgi:hypothetical protein
MSSWLLAAVVVVPLLAGLAVIAVLAYGIYQNPKVANGNVAWLGIAALLCIAPTLVNLAITLPNGTKISLLKEQLQDSFGRQGGEIRAAVEALQQRVSALEKDRGPAAAPAAKPNPNSGKVVVVLYVEERKDLALQLQSYLLEQGYSASAIYTDFTELSDTSRLPSGTVAVVSAENNTSLRNEVEKALKAKFTDLKNATESTSTKIASSSVQVRLF